MNYSTKVCLLSKEELNKIAHFLDYSGFIFIIAEKHALVLDWPEMSRLTTIQ